MNHAVSQQGALPADISPAARRPRVVLVHGIMNTGRIFRHLQRYLDDAGIDTLAPDLVPNHGVARLETLAEQLKHYIDANTAPNDTVHLLGFSMGAMVSRWYLQELGGTQRTRQFLSVAAPYRGTWWSWFALLPGISQMRPGSGFLNRLEAGRESLLSTMETTCFWTPMDLVVIPAASGTLPGAKNVSVKSPCHSCLLSHPTLMRLVADRVFDVDQRLASAP